MIGYITVKKEELKIKDFDCYHAFYCGVCRDIKAEYGQFARLTLTYDMTFLAILLSSVYDKEPTAEKHLCMMHPGSKQTGLQNEFTKYAADMSIIIVYHNLQDDWIDERKKRSLIASGLLKRAYKKASAKYPRQVEAVEKYLEQLHEVEKEGSDDLDKASGLTGDFFREVFKIYDEDIWNKDLGDIGFYLGKFIYLMDAWEDIEEDREKGNYNPFLQYSEREDFEEFSFSILQMMAAEAAAAFERLPAVDHVDILRNILYAGIWNKYGYVKEKGKEKK